MDISKRLFQLGKLMGEKQRAKDKLDEEIDEIKAEVMRLMNNGLPENQLNGKRKTKIVATKPKKYAKYTKQGAIDNFLEDYFRRNTGHEVTLTEIESAARNEVGYEGKRQSLNTCVTRFIRDKKCGAVIEYVSGKKGVYFVGGFEDEHEAVLPAADMAV